MNKLPNKFVILIGAVIVVLGLIVFAFWYSTFRIASVSPNPTPMNVTQIEFTFSHPLEKDYDTKKISVSNGVKGSYRQTDTSIVFDPEGQLPEGRLTFTFPGIRSTSGEQIDAKATVNVKYVPYNQLPKDEQRRQVQESSSYQDQFPITDGYIPHAAPTWKAEYALPEETGVDKLTIMVTPFIEKGTGEPEQDYNMRLEDIRKEFESYILAGNYKLSDYYVLYANSYLSKYDQAPAESPYTD